MSLTQILLKALKESTVQILRTFSQSLIEMAPKRIRL